MTILVTQENVRHEVVNPTNIAIWNNIDKLVISYCFDVIIQILIKVMNRCRLHVFIG